MAKVTVALPQGTRDFGPDTVRKRNYIFNTIRTVFELYGFQPLETPAMENLETLMGKYGEEGDKLIFKILNNGLHQETNKQKAIPAFEKLLQGKSDRDLTERALKYDLTIPFARYVAMNHGQLTFPFKRYQLQPVWRADKPQRGRYREFYQCDADVVGSKSLVNEVELAAIYSEVFRRLRINVEIRINSRKILAALAIISGGTGKMMDITMAIDKLDKIGLEKVKVELTERGLDANQVAIVERYLSISGSNTEKLDALTQLFSALDPGTTGIDELSFILNYDHSPALPLVVDLTLARGLNYYTGTIFEIKAKDSSIGSIGGGGRYDDLTGLFGVPDIPGVGISFGVDRIYDVLEELKLFPDEVHAGTQVLFLNMGDAESRAAFALMQGLRTKGIRCELYPDPAKVDRQFKYAEKKNIPFVITIDANELASNTCIIKNIGNGDRQSIAFNNLGNFSFI